MSDASHKPATYADLEAVPSHLVAEILDGRLLTRRYFGPRDAFQLSELLRSLTCLLRDRQPQLSIVLRPEVHMGGDVLVPELAVWSRKDIDHIEDWRSLKVAPLWALEFVTAETELDVHQYRCRAFAQLSVPMLWRFDNVAEKLQTFALSDHARWRLEQTFARGETIRAQPFEAAEISWTCLDQREPIK